MMSSSDSFATTFFIARRSCPRWFRYALNELPRNVNRLQAGKARHLTESGERISVADRALNRLPEPPLLTSASPFLMLPGGTYATNPE